MAGTSALLSIGREEAAAQTVGFSPTYLRGLSQLLAVCKPSSRLPKLGPQAMSDPHAGNPGAVGDLPSALSGRACSGGGLLANAFFASVWTVLGSLGEFAPAKFSSLPGGSGRFQKAFWTGRLLFLRRGALNIPPFGVGAQRVPLLHGRTLWSMVEEWSRRSHEMSRGEGPLGG